VVVILAMFAAVGLSGAGSHAGPILEWRVLAVVMALLVFASTTNDIADEVIDRVNLAGDTRRPLVVGSGTRRELTIMAGSAALLACAVAATLGWLPLAVAAGGLILVSCYSLRPVRIADRGVVAPLALPACYVAVPFLIGALSVKSSLSLVQCVLLTGLYLAFIGRIVLKDFRDVRGDALFGKRTFLVRHGRKAAITFSAVFWTAGSLLVIAVNATTLPWVGIYSVMLLGALCAMRALARGADYRTEERLISAIAVLGRGGVALLWMHLEMAGAGWSDARTGLIGAAFALITLGQASTIAQFGPRQTLCLPEQIVKERRESPVAAMVQSR
jgi:4-hydroxybenzoate polyprenyltransferase